MKTIEYNQNDLSHVPKSIIYWVSQGVVIEGLRYSVKEFRVEDGKFKLVIERNGEFFEVDTSTGSGGSATIDPETLKGYLKTSDLGAGQGIDVRKLDSGVVVGLTDETKRKLDSLSDRVFGNEWGTVILMGSPTNEADHSPFVIQGFVRSDRHVDIDTNVVNSKGQTLAKVLSGDNLRGIKLTTVKLFEDPASKHTVSDWTNPPQLDVSSSEIKTGQIVHIVFDTE